METSQLCSLRCASFLKQGFLLPVRNVRLLIPTILLAVAYTAVSVLGYSAAVQPLLSEVLQRAEDLWGANPAWVGHAELVNVTLTRAGQLVAAGAAYVIATALTVGPAVSAVTMSAAVAVCTGKRRVTFHALVGQSLTFGLKGPFGAAAFCSALHTVACRGAILVSGCYMAIYLRATSQVVLSVELLLYFLGHLFALYVDVVCSMAVVVSVAEPAGCFHGARALRQAWWLVTEKTTPAVLLAVVKGTGTAVVATIRFYPIGFYHGMAWAVLAEFIYVILYAALQLWFVCATTLYYYHSRQSMNADAII